MASAGSKRVNKLRKFLEEICGIQSSFLRWLLIIATRTLIFPDTKISWEFSKVLTWKSKWVSYFKESRGRMPTPPRFLWIRAAWWNEYPGGITSPTSFWILPVSQVSAMTRPSSSMSLTAWNTSSDLLQIDWQFIRLILTFCRVMPVYGVIGTVNKLLASDLVCFGWFQLDGCIAKQMVLPPWGGKANNWYLA